MINIKIATIQNGFVHVEGGDQAAKTTPVSWEGNATGVQTTKGGAFKFDTTDLPADCVGTLVIGSESREVVIAGCAHPLKTGQTNPFGVTGSDGDLQKGTARSYTDNLNGTITDDSTGLVWEKLTSDATIHDVGNFYTWADAFAKIAALNTANFAGHSDWRLPNVNELQSLADYGRVFPAIDPVFNNGVDSFTQSDFYWSSTTYQNGPARSARGTCTSTTVTCSLGKDFTDDYVLAVRGGS